MLRKEQDYVYQIDWQLKPKQTHAFFFFPNMDEVKCSTLITSVI